MESVAYDEALAERVRQALKGKRISEKQMFGGVAWMRDEKMFIGVVKDELMVRVGKDAHEDAIRRPHARTMDFTGRPMMGYVFVAAPGAARVKDIASWAQQAYDHVAAIKKKPAKRAAKLRARAGQA